MSLTKFPKAISAELIIKASVEKIYRAWTTTEGIKSFFAPDCNIKMEVMGPYEMIFLPENGEGSRGGEGNVVLTFQKNKMLSFTWNAPPELEKVRNERTHVLIQFIPLNDKETKLLFHQDGWGEGDEWDKAYEYFEYAWKKVVLPRLQYRFESGPVDWKNPPKFT
jgi:uncharacterized protein YndB with AHSA1/START domain